MNPLKELSRHLKRHNIEYEYDDDTIVIDFAEKQDHSQYPINYQIMEITYSPEKESFILELSSTMNIKDYPLLHPAVHTINREYKLIDTHSDIALNASFFILASFIRQYIQASTIHITLFNQLQNV